MVKISLLLLSSIAGLMLQAQSYSSTIFTESSKITVLNINGDTLAFPFAGGLNSCQFGGIDLNNDGVKDLVVFDRHGDRLLTFINNNKPGVISYTWDQKYASRFPQLREWVELVDYNGDGKEDIFTYTTGGIKVYRNDSDTALHFTQVSHPYLVSMQGTTLTNILVTSADYPALVDVDNDGDLDVLTFWGLGSFVEWHRNMSMERYGVPDSLEFVKSSNCWGRFAEGAESNAIKLDTCVSFDKPVGLKDGDPKHTGSTLLAYDFRGVGRKDLVVGDVDFPTLIALENGGSADTAIMTSQSADFPDAVHPVNLPSFPAASLLDVNNDGRPDLLASPFDPSLIRSQNSHSSWLYLNQAKKSPSYDGFTFHQDDFLQKDMLDFGSGAYPVLFDYNADGLLDLIVGNYGYLDTTYYSPSTGLVCEYVASLALLRNIGTLQQPAFRLVDRDYLGLSSLKMQSLIPAIGDIDGDGVPDLICGNSKGKLVFLQNKAQPGHAANFILSDPAFRQIDVGDFNAPQVVDLDGDGLNDLVCGRRDGRLSFYRNTGPVSLPQFSLLTDSLGGVDITNTALSYYGYSVPFFFRGKNGKLQLYVGSEFGDVFVYKDIEENLNGKFTLAGTLYGVKEGWRSAVAAGNLDGDTLTELFVGNYSGGLSYYKGATPSAAGFSGTVKGSVPGLRLSPNPANDKVTLDIPGLKYPLLLDIDITDLTGRNLISLKKDTTFPVSISVSALPPGIYLVKIRSVPGISGLNQDWISKLLICR